MFSSCYYEMVTKKSPKNATKHVVRDMKKRRIQCKNVAPQQCGTDVCKNNMDCFLFAGLFLMPSENGRRSVTSFPPHSSLHTMQNAIREPLYYHMEVTSW